MEEVLVDERRMIDEHKVEAVRDEEHDDHHQVESRAWGVVYVSKIHNNIIIIIIIHVSSAQPHRSSCPCTGRTAT